MSTGGAKARRVGPRPVATSVAFGEGMLRVTLGDGRQIAAPLEWFPRLCTATPEERGRWLLISGGVGIHWDALDEDVSVAGLLAG